MRILMLSELYPPHIGGSEEYVRNLSRGLVSRGHDVSVATIASRNEPSIADEEGVRVHRVRSTTQRASSLMPSGRPYLPPIPDPDVVQALRAILKAERPDVVHAHNWMVHSFLPLKRASRTGLVMTLHDYSVVCAKRSLLYRERPCSGPGFSKCLRCASDNYGAARGPVITLSNWTMRPWLTRAVDMFVPVSEYVATGNELAQRNLPFRVIPNFVPDEVATASDPDHPALKALPDGPFWLFVGALSRHKGVHVLLEAYARVPGAPRLVLLGRDAPDAPASFPPNVTLIRDVPHDAVMAAWARASLGVIPSVFPDPCPTVAIEAMAAGVPVVASRIGGLPDLVVDGETGLLVGAADVTELSSALRRMCDEPVERARMAEAARQRAPLFMAGSVIPQIEQIYRETAQ
jgi:glycosyltransferase involved in cell wall biosynthesis